MGEIKNKSYYSYEYSQIISEYRNIWIKRYSGYYGNFFEIIRSFIDCNNLNIFKRIFMFFQILGYIVEFIFPSFSSIVIYTIFYEAFNIYDERPAVLCTFIYLILLISSGVCSLVTMNSTKIQFTNLIFYFFFEIYYLFILLCSIVAMDNVRKNKNKTNTNSPYQFKSLDLYQFNTKAIICIIIFTVIPGILPMIFKYETIFDNFIPLLLYLLLGASPSSSSFYMAKILNACETCGGKNIPERKGITILIYILSNLFFGSLIFFNDTRKKKADMIMSLGIIYLIYNFFKVTAIVINILINNNNLNIWPSVVDEEIKKELDVKKKKKNKTEKQNKKLSSNNDYSNNYYQSTKISKNLFDSTFIQDSPSKLQ
jgi:hypothetical protein